MAEAIGHWLPIGTEEEGSLNTAAGLMRYRVLRPLRSVADIAWATSATDLTKRIPVHGQDEASIYWNSNPVPRSGRRRTLSSSTTKMNRIVEDLLFLHCVHGGPEGGVGAEEVAGAQDPQR